MKYEVFTNTLKNKNNMRKISFKYLLIIALTTGMFSCVPQRKLEEEQAKRELSEKELAALKTSAMDCDTKLKEATKQMADDTKVITGLQKDTSIIGTSYRSLTSKYDKLNQINEQLLDKYNRLLEGNLADTKKIAGELQMTQEQLLKKQDELKNHFSWI